MSTTYTSKHAERMKTRMVGILKLLRENPNGVTTAYLADEFGYSIKTIRQDLQTLSYNGYAQYKGNVWVPVKKVKAS